MQAGAWDWAQAPARSVPTALEVLTTASCSPCDAGRYGDATTQMASTCVGVRSGILLPRWLARQPRHGRERRSRAAGYYCPPRQVQLAGGACPLGHYCVADTKSPAGTYGALGGATTNACNGPCAAGYCGGQGATAAQCGGACLSCARAAPHARVARRDLFVCCDAAHGLSGSGIAGIVIAIAIVIGAGVFHTMFYKRRKAASAPASRAYRRHFHDGRVTARLPPC